MEKLREELAKLLFDWIEGDGWEWDEVDEAIQNHYRVKADSILSLIAPELEKARKALIAVQDLIANSYGVVGLHLNGDAAPWDSLLEGGQFEDWLKDFSEAVKEDS